MQEPLESDGAFLQLEVAAQEVCKQIHRQLLTEAQKGEARPRLSVLSQFVLMTPEQIEQCIELYQTAHQPGEEQSVPRANVPAVAAKDRADLSASAWLGDALDSKDETEDSVEPQEDAQDHYWDSAWNAHNEWQGWNGWGEQSGALYQKQWSANDADRIGAGRKLYVGNLPADVRVSDIRDVFSTYGTIVDVHVMQGRQKHTGQSCAMVVFLKVEEALSCVAAMWNGYEFRVGEGPLVVKFAEDQEEKGKGKGKSKSKGKEIRKGKSTSIRPALWQ